MHGPKMLQDSDRCHRMSLILCSRVAMPFVLIVISSEASFAGGDSSLEAARKANDLLSRTG